MKIIITNSLEETQKFAEDFAKKFKGSVIALNGELGSGKTSFTQGFAKGLGIKDKVISPTFVLIRQHEIPKTKVTLFHIDLYRLESETDFKQLGINELITNTKNVVLIEWANKASLLLPEDTTYISFETVGENKRKITVE